MKKKKKPKRFRPDSVINFRITKSQKQSWQKAADLSKTQLSAWMRNALDAATKQTKLASLSNGLPPDFPIDKLCFRCLNLGKPNCPKCLSIEF